MKAMHKQRQRGGRGCPCVQPRVRAEQRLSQGKAAFQWRVEGCVCVNGAGKDEGWRLRTHCRDQYSFTIKSGAKGDQIFRGQKWLRIFWGRRGASGRWGSAPPPPPPMEMKQCQAAKHPSSTGHRLYYTVPKSPLSTPPPPPPNEGARAVALAESCPPFCTH